jgi:uncharacterized protein YecT (DUF1311 family)
MQTGGERFCAIRDTPRRHLPALIFAVSLAIPPMSWAQDDPAIEACHNQQSTLDIVNCLDKLTAQSDKRLNAAYQKGLKSVDASAVPMLRAAERAWLEYRKQRCSYLSAGPGTIGQVIGSDCFLRMTRARAAELEQDSKGLGE